MLGLVRKFFQVGKQVLRLIIKKILEVQKPLMVHAFTVSNLGLLKDGFMTEVYFHRQLTPFCRKHFFTFLFLLSQFCHLAEKIHPDNFRQTVISQSFQDFSLSPWNNIQVPGSVHGVMASGQPSNPRASGSLPASAELTTQLGCQVVFLRTDICCSIPSTRPQDLCRPT